MTLWFFRDYIGIMDKKMEITLMGYKRVVIPRD